MSGSTRSSSSSARGVGGGSTGGSPLLVPVSSALTPKTLLKRYKLPTAAHLHTPTAPPGLDLSRPLLLYNTYNSVKVRAVSLRSVRDGSNYSPVGPAIVIPDSYTGWFSLVTSDGQTAPHYSTVEEVANNQVSFFLTRYDVPAYTNLQDDDGRVSYQKTVVQSGHVLKFMGIFEDLNSTKKTNSGGRSRDSSSVFNSQKYAQCLNYRNEVVFLPYSASGRFYTTAHKNSKNPNHVYLMAQILKNHKLPVTVKLVCGYMPRVPCNFTGVLRLEKQQKEAVILACTMTNEAQATLFEIDVSSNFVLIPVKDPVFSKAPIFLKTVSYCEDEAETWRRQIKVTHHVTEKRSRSLTRSLSDKFVEPLTSVRPLNLSFLGDLDKKVRSRDKSKESRSSNQIIRDKSRDQQFRQFRSREKSVEKTGFKYHDRSSSFSGYPFKDPSQEKPKKSDHRKISKQNTYVLQNGKSTKHEKKTESESGLVTNRSVENMDYSRVVDDISPIPENAEDGESHYAEICDLNLGSRNFARNDAPMSLPNLSFSAMKDEEILSEISIDSNIFTKRDSLIKSSRKTGSPMSSPGRKSIASVISPFRKSVSPVNIKSSKSSSSVSSTPVSEIFTSTVRIDSPVSSRPASEVDSSKVQISNSRMVEETSVEKENNEMLEKDKVNEVYIIRVVVKDKEDDRMATLAKDSSGGYYMKIRGFEVPQEEIGSTVNGDEQNGYDSLC